MVGPAGPRVVPGVGELASAVSPGVAGATRTSGTAYGVSHGFANGIVLRYRERGTAASDDDLVGAQYAGAKAALRPIYDAIVAAVTAFGADVEVVPKRTGVSLRRSKQFAVVEAPSAKRVQLGIQLKGDAITDRLLAGNAMCSHKVNLGQVEGVDDELVGWLREAYERA